MKRTIKNKELEEILNNVSHLGNFPMPGELTLAIIEARKVLKDAYENYNEACKQVGETRCERDSNQKPLTEFQKDEQGNELTNRPRKLKFRDTSTENAALNELKKLGEQEIDLNRKEFDKSLIKNLSEITPIQMEAITSLIAIVEK